MLAPSLARSPDQIRLLDPADRLFRHTLKESWGVGLLVAEERYRRRYRFEDGALRAIREGYYHFIVAVDSDNLDIERIFQQLAGEHDLAVAEESRAAARERRPPVMTFADQLKVFLHLYPEGFEDDKWVHAYRHPVNGGRRKSHAITASKLAQEALTREAIAAKLEEEDHGGLLNGAMEILQTSDFVSPSKDLFDVEEIEPTQRSILAHSLMDLLYGEEAYRNRFGRWLTAMRRATGTYPSWALATAIPALMFPDQHICVRRNAVENQARSLSPRANVEARPTRDGYRWARRVAQAVKGELEKVDQHPRDLIDVAAFMRETLRPKAVQILDGL